MTMFKSVSYGIFLFLFAFSAVAEDSAYRVNWCGREIKTFPVDISAMPFNRVWPGHQRDKSQSEVAEVARFDVVQPGKLEIAAKGVGEVVATRYGCESDTIRHVTVEDIELDYVPQMSQQLQKTDDDVFHRRISAGSTLICAAAYGIGKSLGDQQTGELGDPNRYHILYEDLAFRRWKALGDPGKLSISMQTQLPHHEIRDVKLEDLPEHTLVTNGNVQVKRMESDAARHHSEMMNSTPVSRDEARSGGRQDAGAGKLDRAACAEALHRLDERMGDGGQCAREGFRPSSFRTGDSRNRGELSRKTA